MIELLAPAGTKEKLQTAFNYGADACYFAGTKYGLRAYSVNFTNYELKESIEYAHSINSDVYLPSYGYYTEYPVVYKGDANQIIN